MLYVQGCADISIKSSFKRGKEVNSDDEWEKKSLVDEATVSVPASVLKRLLSEIKRLKALEKSQQEEVVWKGGDKNGVIEANMREVEEWDEDEDISSIDKRDSFISDEEENFEIRK